MLGSIRDYLDRRAVMRRLPAVLVERYGAKAQYSDGQVMKALEVAGIRPGAIAYAAAAYMDRAEAIELLQHESVYLRARRALAAHYYNDDMNFSVDLRGLVAKGETV